MGLKSKLNKMKSFLFDDEEESVKKPKVAIKKDSKKEIEKEIEKEEKKLPKTQDIEELYFEDVSEVKEDSGEIKSRVQKKEAEFKFPQFDDDDFAVSKVRPEPLFEKQIKEEPKKVLYQGSKRKEETKKFKPSPIISPIYGLLDSEGNTIKEEDKKEKVKYEEVSLDSVRKKAYGIDNELENTMKRLSKKTIEEAEKDMEKEEKELSREKSKKIIEKESVLVKEEDNDDMILPNINFKEIDVDKDRKKLNDIKDSKQDIIKKENLDDDDDDDTKEQDLFNLIDSMYQKEGSEE